MLRNKLGFFFFAVNLSTKIQIFKPNNVIVLRNPCLPSCFQGIHCRCTPRVAVVLPVGPGSFPSPAVLRATPTQRGEYFWPEGRQPMLRSFHLQFRGFDDKIKCGVWQERVAKQWQEVVELFMGNTLGTSTAPSRLRKTLWGISQLMEPCIDQEQLQ